GVSCALRSSSRLTVPREDTPNIVPYFAAAAATARSPRWWKRRCPRVALRRQDEVLPRRPLSIQKDSRHLGRASWRSEAVIVRTLKGLMVRRPVGAPIAGGETSRPGCTIRPLEARGDARR